MPRKADVHGVLPSGISFELWIDSKDNVEGAIIKLHDFVLLVFGAGDDLLYSYWGRQKLDAERQLIEMEFGNYKSLIDALSDVKVEGFVHDTRRTD